MIDSSDVKKLLGYLEAETTLQTALREYISHPRLVLGDPEGVVRGQLEVLGIKVPCWITREQVRDLINRNLAYCKELQQKVSEGIADKARSNR